MRKWFAGLFALVLLCTCACQLKASEETDVPEPTAASQETPAPESQETPASESTPEPTEAPSCADAIVGEWKIVSVEIGEASYDPSAIRMDSSVSFYQNETGRMSVTTGGQTFEETIAYKAAGNTVTMLDENNDPLTAIYDPETNTIRMEWQSAMVIVLAPKGDVPETDGEEWKTAELERYVADDGMEMVTIRAAIPAGATLRIDFQNQEDYVYVSDKSELSYRKIRIPVPVFYPNAPVGTEETTIVPKITITLPEGGEFDVECPGFTVTFPTLLIALDSSAKPTQDGYRVKAGSNGTYQLYGFVRSNEEGSPSVDAGVQMTVNGEVIPVYEGGIILADLPVIGNAPTTYTLIAEKSNYVTATVDVVVEP
ncbi:MAG: hypothetical protein II117_02485 [Clostridia bacterium]|nr:hypothetical protein [Clostridia bacterium]